MSLLETMRMRCNTPVPATILPCHGSLCALRILRWVVQNCVDFPYFLRKTVPSCIQEECKHGDGADHWISKRHWETNGNQVREQREPFCTIAKLSVWTGSPNEWLVIMGVDPINGISSNLCLGKFGIGVLQNIGV